jgi:3-hydroxyisobutyrate dehydrogenase-like beta-hydroxyacid dehydrogenase
MKTIGIVGIGEMGLPMARNLGRRGFDVRAYDSRKEAVRAFADTGGGVTASAAEAVAGADAVIIMVRTPAQVEEVVLGRAGVLARMAEGAMLIVMSTVSVACMRRLGEAARGRKLAFLDAPVSGGRAGAEKATLTIIVGGTAPDVERARPALEAMGSRIAHVGEVGAGTAVKIGNQILLTASLLAAREVAVLVEAGGVTPETAWDVIQTCTGTTWVVQNWPVAAAWMRDYRPGSSLDILVKDTGIAIDMAREEGVPAPLLSLVSQMIVSVTRQLAERASS